MTRISKDSNKAVFLDRDGTLMQDVPYLSRPGGVQIVPGAKDSLWRLRNAGFHLVIVTNQSGIARGYFTEREFWQVQGRLEEELGPGLIQAVYFCPDGPEQASSRRKPAPGMLHEAARDFSLALEESFLIGDKISDVEAGVRAGLRLSILLGGPADDLLNVPGRAVSAATLRDAAELILGIVV